MRYFEIVEKYEQTRKEGIELDKEYKDKKKGDAYRKRRTQIIHKMDKLKNQAEQLGTQGSICHVRGKRSRPHRKNPQIRVQESFNLYFVNVTEQEASALVKLHVKNVDIYQITFIKAGMIITSS